MGRAKQCPPQLNKQRETSQNKQPPHRHPAAPPVATRPRRSKEPNQAWRYPTTAVAISSVRSLAVYSRLCPTKLQAFDCCHTSFCTKEVRGNRLALTQASPDPVHAKSGLPTASSYPSEGKSQCSLNVGLRKGSLSTWCPSTTAEEPLYPL